MAEVCPFCGKEIQERTMEIAGHTFHATILCECQKAAREQRERESKERKKHDAVIAAYQWSNIGKRLQDCYFENFDSKNGQRELFEFCKKFVVHFDKFYEGGMGGLFTGAPGTGKTHMAVATFREVLMKNRTAAFVRSTDLITRLSEAMRFSSDESVSELVSFINGMDFFVLDDLGAHKMNDFALDFLYKIIDGRNQSMKPTFITTNLTTNDLKVLLGDRIYDRISGSTMPIHVTGTSKRMDMKAKIMEEIIHGAAEEKNEALLKKKEKFERFISFRPEQKI